MMMRAALGSFVLIGAVIGMTPALGQQPNASMPAPASNTPSAATTATPSASTTAAASTAQAPAAPAAPSEDMLKRVHQAGYRPQVSKGVTKYCKEETSTGSHFTQKKCLTWDQLAAQLDLEQQDRDQLLKNSLTAPGLRSN
jgi:hypothetical protein